MTPQQFELVRPQELKLDASIRRAQTTSGWNTVNAKPITATLLAQLSRKFCLSSYWPSVTHLQTPYRTTDSDNLKCLIRKLNVDHGVFTFQKRLGFVRHISWCAVKQLGLFCGYPYGLYSLHVGLHPTTRSLLPADEVGPPCILLKLKDSLIFTGSLGLGASLIGLGPSTLSVTI